MNQLYLRYVSVVVLVGITCSIRVLIATFCFRVFGIVHSSDPFCMSNYSLKSVFFRIILVFVDGVL